MGFARQNPDAEGERRGDNARRMIKSVLCACLVQQYKCAFVVQKYARRIIKSVLCALCSQWS